MKSTRSPTTRNNHVIHEFSVKIESNIASAVTVQMTTRLAYRSFGFPGGMIVSHLFSASALTVVPSGIYAKLILISQTSGEAGFFPTYISCHTRDSPVQRTIFFPWSERGVSTGNDDTSDESNTYAPYDTRGACFCSLTYFHEEGFMWPACSWKSDESICFSDHSFLYEYVVVVVSLPPIFSWLVELEDSFHWYMSTFRERTTPVTDTWKVLSRSISPLRVPIIWTNFPSCSREMSVLGDSITTFRHSATLAITSAEWDSLYESPQSDPMISTGPRIRPARADLRRCPHERVVVTVTLSAIMNNMKEYIRVFYGEKGDSQKYLSLSKRSWWIG